MAPCLSAQRCCRLAAALLLPLLTPGMRPDHGIFEQNRHADLLRSGVAVGAAAPHEVAKRSNVLYVVRTWHKNYDTRLRSIMRTWARSVDPDSLLFVGDKSHDNPQVLASPGCGSDHGLGLCCKTGHALALARGRMAGRSWALVVDDDTYVSPNNIENALSGHNASSLVALGCNACGPKLCSNRGGNFCGGCGYAVSAAAMEALVDKSHEAFEKEMVGMAASSEAEQYDDIAVSCLLKRRGVATKSLEGMHGWKLENQKAYLAAVRAANPAPLTFHYVSADTMAFLQDAFDHAPSATSSVLEGTMEVENSSYNEQLLRYANYMNEHRYATRSAEAA